MVLQNILKRNTFDKNVTLLIFIEFLLGGPDATNKHKTRCTPVSCVYNIGYRVKQPNGRKVR
jgi:hypothetical protein